MGVSACSSCILTGTYAARPAASVPGRIYLQSDGPFQWRDDGTVWTPWTGNYPCTDPTLSTFAWVNQGGATVSTVNGGIFLNAPASGTVNLRIRKMLSGAAPWTWTVRFLPHFFYTGAVYKACGILCRESGTGKITVLNIKETLQLEADNYLSETDAAAAQIVVTGGAVPLFAPPAFRIRDDNTNLIFSWSNDGVNFGTPLATIGRTSFMAGGANEIGFYANTQDSAIAAGMTVLSAQLGA